MLTKRADMNGKHLLPDKEITSIANDMDMFLESIPLEKRVIFIRRYWFCDTYAEIASRYGISERKVRRQIQGIREQMCIYLEKPWGTFGINQVNFKYINEAESAAFPGEQRYQNHYLSFALDIARFIINSIFSPEYA